MANLYNLTVEFLRLQQMLEDGVETPEEMDELEVLLDNAAQSITDKADGYARIMRNLTSEVDAIRAEEKRLAAHRRTMENGIERLKEAMYNNMKLMGESKIKTSIGSWGIQKNPPSVLVTNQEAIPTQYWNFPAPELKRSMVLAALKEGAVIDGCQLQQTESLRFR